MYVVVVVVIVVVVIIFVNNDVIIIIVPYVSEGRFHWKVLFPTNMANN